jgi:hypothetical protein
MIKGMKSVDKVFLSKKALNNYMSKRAEAFSIAELAVVVAAVGLLSFGVLKSGELITNARVKSVLHEIQEIKNGVSSYRIANDYLPGDNPSIDSTGNNYILREDGDPANQINFSGFGQGNGDGIITYGATPTLATSVACANGTAGKLGNESALAFAQMVLAGYLSGGISNTASLYDSNAALSNYIEALGAGYQSSKLSGVYYSFLGVKAGASNAFLSRAGDFGNFNGVNLILGGISGTTFSSGAATLPSDIIVLNNANSAANGTSYSTIIPLATGDCGITAFGTAAVIPTPTKAIIAPKIVDGIKAALGSQVKSCSSPIATSNCSATDDQVVSVPLY